MDFPELRTAVYGLSYHSREISRPLYDGFTAARAEPFEILLAHGGDEKHIPFDRRAMERAGFDYIALGHIHKPMILKEDQIIYSGALEPVDKNDTGPHGYVKRRDNSIGSPDSVDSVCFKRIHSSRDPNKPRRYNRKYQTGD